MSSKKYNIFRLGKVLLPRCTSACINKIISSVRAVFTVLYHLSDTLLTKLRHTVGKTLTRFYQNSGSAIIALLQGF